MEYGYKFRIYPTAAQEVLINKTFGCVRYVHNRALAERQEAYTQTGKSPNRFQQSKELTGWKQELEWLREPDKCALQNAIKDVDVAFQNFFRRCKNGEKPGYPKFKSKRDHYQSYRTNSPTVRVSSSAVQLPKLGKVKCRVSKEVKGRILSATVSRNPSGKYFVSLCCTDVEMAPLPSTGAVVGVTLGANALAVTSDGAAYSVNPESLSKDQKRLTSLQRKISRKSKDSHNREKARIAFAKVHEKIVNQKVDALHKLTSDLVRHYDVICIEDVADTDKGPRSRYLDDASWGEFRRQLEYKAQWYGKTIVKVDGSCHPMQLCSSCGELYSGTEDLSLVNSWKCPSCGAIHDRDMNTAVNILNEGLRLLA